MHRNRCVVSLCAAGVLCVLAVATAQQGQPDRPPSGERPRQPEGGPRGGQGASVEGSMKGMGRALKQLNDQVVDASAKEASLKLIGDAQRACIAAKNGQAEKLAEIQDPAERTKKAETFRRKLMAVARKLIDIEQDILDGKGGDAKVKIGEVLKMRDSGHEEFGVE